MGGVASIGSRTLYVIELATKLTVIGVPALYLVGWAYLEAYWAVFGISETLLGLSASDYVRAGGMVFVRHIVGGSPWVAILAWAALLLLIAIMMLRTFAMPLLFAGARRFHAIVVSLRKEGRVEPKHRRLARAVDAGVDTARTLLMNVLLIFLLVLGLVYLAIQPSNTRGKESAQKQLSDLASFPTPERNWVLGYTEAESARPALVIGCGSEMCMLLRSEKTELLPRAAVSRMETCRRVNRADDGTFHCIGRMALL
jgi:hypothetical protein